MNAVQKHQAIHDAAERIFSHAVDWNEGRKKWDGETVEHIIRHELEKAELNAKPTLGKRIYRGALWLAVTAAIVAAMWLGIHGTKPAWNMFVFLQWLNTLIWIMLYSARNEKNYFSDFPAQSFPAWVYSVSDLTIAIVLAAFGHFVYASFSIVQMLCEQGFYAARAKSQELKAKS